MKFPGMLFETISSSYYQIKKIPLQERMDCMKNWGWPDDGRPWPLLSIDGIFVLSDGFILKRDRLFKDGVRFLFNSFSVKSKNESQVYSVFESEILSSLGKFSNGNQGLWYIDQAGLLSLRSQIKVKPSEPKNLMIFPKVAAEDLYKDLDAAKIYEKSEN
jgi:hypothetical protein